MLGAALWVQRDPPLQGDPVIARGTGDGFPVIAGAFICWSSWAYVPVYLSREVFSCCIGAVIDRNLTANRLLSACRSRHSHKEPRRGDVSWVVSAADSFSFHPFFPSPNLHQDKPTDFTTVCSKGSSLGPCSCRAAASLAVHFSTLSIAFSCFDLLGVFLLFAIAHENLGKSKQFISHVYYLLDGQ